MTESPSRWPRPQPLSPADEKLWSSFAHLGSILGLLPSLIILLLFRTAPPRRTSTVKRP